MSRMSAYQTRSDDDEVPVNTAGIPIVRDPLVLRHDRDLTEDRQRLARLEWCAWIGVVMGIGLFTETTFSLVMHSLGVW